MLDTTFWRTMAYRAPCRANENKGHGWTKDTCWRQGWIPRTRILAQDRNLTKVGKKTKFNNIMRKSVENVQHIKYRAFK